MTRRITERLAREAQGTDWALVFKVLAWVAAVALVVGGLGILAEWMREVAR